ncbi:MAG: protein kinase [bacterium]|nr:protein kinase [bacterium]
MAERLTDTGDKLRRPSTADQVQAHLEFLRELLDGDKGLIKTTAQNIGAEGVGLKHMAAVTALRVLREAIPASRPALEENAELLDTLQDTRQRLAGIMGVDLAIIISTLDRIIALLEPPSVTPISVAPDWQATIAHTAPPKVAVGTRTVLGRVREQAEELSGDTNEKVTKTYDTERRVFTVSRVLRRAASEGRREVFAAKVAAARRLQEAQTESESAHPQLIRILTVKDDLIEMEWCPGGSLATFMEGKKPDDFDGITALRIFLRVAEAIRFAHGQELVHGNLSPDKILFREKSELPNPENLAVADFSAGLRQDTKSRYRAPEQEKNGIGTAATDTYALGQLLKDLWNFGHTGTRPKSGPVARLARAASTRLSRAVMGSFSTAQQLQQPISILIQNMTHRDHAQRPGLDEVVKQLGGHLSDHPSEDGELVLLAEAGSDPDSEES